jgi:protein gp37
MLKLGEWKMNKTKIEWTDFSWNPITGCNHGCWYCYAKKLTTRFKKVFPNGFKPTFYPTRLKEPWKYKKPSKIFVCSISDLFAPWTLPYWRSLVMVSIKNCPVKHTFQLLTKNPELIPRDRFPDNVWIGTTVTNKNGDWRNIEEIKKVTAKIRFVSFEPLLNYLPIDVCLDGLQWIIIGKLTGSRRIKLNGDWVHDIINEAERHDIPFFLKHNLGWNYKNQEYPYG